ncbi:MAG: hypothetical protein ABIL58_22205 [Pseudomonadota bacterium]
MIFETVCTVCLGRVVNPEPLEAGVVEVGVAQEPQVGLKDRQVASATF